jgi:ATP-dependent Clp protease, protease subunit
MTTAYIGLFSSIDEEVMRKSIDLIANKLPEDTDTLYVLFSTNGGDVSAGFVLYNFLRALPLKIVMHNVGSVDSIGNVIFMAGQERYVTPNGTFLIHRVKSTTNNDNAEVSYIHEKLSTIVTEEKKIKSVFMERSRMPSDEFEARFAKGELQDADYAIKHGLADEIRELKLPPHAQIRIIGQSEEEG